MPRIPAAPGLGKSTRARPESSHTAILQVVCETLREVGTAGLFVEFEWGVNILVPSWM